MKTALATLAASAALFTLGACENTPPSQRNAGIGAAVGAVAGAAVADDDTTGALIGGALGAAAGDDTGCREEGGCFVGGDRVDAERRYDSAAPEKTVWTRGPPRPAPQPRARSM